MFKYLKQNTYNYLLFFAIVVTASIFTPTANAITLIPASLDLELIPGQAVDRVIKLFNETSNTVELYTEVVNFTVKDDTGQPSFDFTSERVGLSAWIQVEKGPIIIESGKREEVPVIISPPLNADPGGYYAALFFVSAPPEKKQVKIVSKIGTLVLANVDGEVLKQGAISEFIVEDGRKMFNHLPTDFTGWFKNLGNVHLKPTGYIKINNLFGKTVDLIEFNPSHGVTMPEVTRKYNIIWKKGTVNNISGNMWLKFWKECSNEKNNFGFGKYTAYLNVVTGTKGMVSDNLKVTFWVLPWRVLLIWFLVIMIGVFLLVYSLKKYNRWIIKNSKKSLREK